MENIKLQPQDLEAEKSVLGSILIDDEAMFDIAEILQPELFYASKHQKIYA